MKRAASAFGLLFLGVAAVFLTSCASTAEITKEARDLVQTQKAALAAAPSCCDDASKLSYAPLGTTSRTFEISPGPARVFERGKSYFVPVAVPPSGKKSFLLVKSNPILWRRHGLPYIFKPSAIALDENFVESGKWIDLPLCFSQGWTREKTGYFSVVEFTPETQSNLIFFTSKSALEGSTHYGASGMAAGIGYAVAVSVEYDYPHSPLGELEIGPLSDDMHEYLRKRCPSVFTGSSSTH